MTKRIIAMVSLVFTSACHRLNAETNTYSPQRMNELCSRIESAWRVWCTRDIGAQIDMLEDSEPWVRRHVLWRLSEDTDLSSVSRDVGFNGFDTEKNVQKISQDTSQLRRLLREQGKSLRHKGASNEIDPKGIHGNVRISALFSLIDLAGRELRAGNRDAADLLVALIDVEPVAVQAAALRSLIPKTTFEHTRQDISRLNPNVGLDSEFVARTRDKFLAWWAENSATYVPEKSKKPVPR